MPFVVVVRVTTCAGTGRVMFHGFCAVCAALAKFATVSYLNSVVTPSPLETLLRSPGRIPPVKRTTQPDSNSLKTTRSSTPVASTSANVSPRSLGSKLPVPGGKRQHPLSLRSLAETSMNRELGEKLSIPLQQSAWVIREYHL